MAQSLSAGTEGCTGRGGKPCGSIGPTVVDVHSIHRRFYCGIGHGSNLDGPNGQHLDKYFIGLQSHRHVVRTTDLAELGIASHRTAPIEFGNLQPQQS